MTAEDGLPVVDATHGKADATYDINGRCLTCGQRFVVRRLRGIDPPLSVRCPGACGTSLFGWRAALTSPAAPEGLSAGSLGTAILRCIEDAPSREAWEDLSIDEQAERILAHLSDTGESS